MSSSHRLILIVIIIFQFICLTHNQSSCNTSSASIGCTACNSPDVLAYNQSSALYTCIGIANCAVVVGSNCVKCTGPYYVYNNACYYNMTGCITGNTTFCIQCDKDYVLLINGTCFKKSIPFCSVYNQTQCIKCQYSLMNSASNCSIDTSICLLFDYSIMKCTKCDINQIIKSDGMGCNTIVDNCQVYDNAYMGLCLLCKLNYMFDNNTNTCVSTQANAINQQILIYNYSASTYTYQYTCLDNSQEYINSTCAAIISSIKHCKIANGTTCLQCLNGYYRQSSNSCTQCDIKISNCALCSSVTYCTSCMYGYYKLVIDSASTKCMPCSSYNCLHCSTQLNGNNQVQCLSCPTNYTLYAGACFNCQNNSYAFSIIQSKCLSCNQSLINCRFCKFTGNSNQSIICVECAESYYYNQITNLCQLITSITNATNITQSTFEILKKLGPGIQVPLYNNRSGLMSICNQTDGYVCICSVVSSDQTSFCSNFVNYNTTTTIINSAILYINDLVTKSPDQFRMLAQFPTYPSTNLPFTNQSYSQYQFWNILSAYTYMLQRASNISIAQILAQHAVTMGPVFSDQKITILKGNGFYYKYIPTGLASGGSGDDDYLYTNLNNSFPVSIYVFYSRYNIQGLITGAIYVITDNNNNNFTVRVRKTRHFDDQTNLSVKVSGVVNTNLNATLSNGILVITNFTKSKSVEVYSSSATTTDDTYQSQRIQNIFYSQSWLYILFFIALYLIFIPLCSIIDCCQSEQYTRKKVGEQQPSDKSEETTIIRINYRQFFPLYNVGNTRRPRRLAKVCLFIVNMQHIITFLTLVYFNLPENTPIGAIALVIPAYIMVVIMGYICGAIFRKLKGHFKYVINVFSLGYWFLWFFLMRIMTVNSSQYRLYILVFAIICFFLDLVIDALETLLVYFAIKQGQSQVNLFNCLARWLSYRGFYQFDKLAREIQGQNQ